MSELIRSDSDIGVNITGMPMGLAVMFNDKLFDRCKQIAGYIAKAEGITPPHLIGKSEACFGVVTRSLTWKLDPWAVMQSTYQTPGGRIGFEGKLIQAILENSGKLDGPVRYEHFGDWSKVVGKFELKKGSSGKDYPVVTWTRADAKDLGVTVIAKVKGELEPRTLDVKLDEMFPLNSTLWATRPKQQICYTACRAFANICAPGLLMGVPFDVDPDADSNMRDITPARPKFSDFEKAAATPAAVTTAGEDEMPTPSSPVQDEELSAADAFAMGKEDRQRGKSIYSAPDQWKPGLNDAWIEAWKEGWREQDAETSG